MNGSGIPVGGIVLVTTAIFTNTCIAICVITPITSKDPNNSSAFIAINNILQINAAKTRIKQTAPNNPNSSQMIENI